MKFKAILVASAAALTLAACAPTGRVSVVSNGEVTTGPVINVISGSSYMYKRMSSVIQDCSSGGQVFVVRVVQAPEHGRVNVVQTTKLVSFPASSPLAKCNGRNVPATVINYDSEAGYVGQDFFEVEIKAPSGLKITNRVTVNVR